MNGIAAAEEALRRWPGLKIITLSMYGDEDYYFRMVSLGVKGFILKNSDIKDVVAAIEAVVEGGSFFSQELLFNLVSNLKSAPSAVRTTVPSSCRSASPRFCCISAGASRTTRSPTRCSFPSGRSTSIARTFWPRRVVRIRPIWSFTRSKTIWSRSDPPALHSVSGEAFSVRLVSAPLLLRMEKAWNFDFSCPPRMTLEEPGCRGRLEAVGKEPEHRMGLQWFYKHNNQIGRSA